MLAATHDLKSIPYAAELWYPARHTWGGGLLNNQWPKQKGGENPAMISRLSATSRVKMRKSFETVSCKKVPCLRLNGTHAGYGRFVLSAQSGIHASLFGRCAESGTLSRRAAGTAARDAGIRRRRKEYKIPVAVRRTEEKLPVCSEMTYAIDDTGKFTLRVRAPGR